MGERVYKKRKKEGEEVKMEKYITVNKELIGKKIKAYRLKRKPDLLYYTNKGDLENLLK
jgi:hypothetical protein